MRSHVFRTSVVTWIVCGFLGVLASIAVQFGLAMTVFGRAAAVMTPLALLDVVTVPLAGAVCGPAVLGLIESGNRVFGVVPAESEG